MSGGAKSSKLFVANLSSKVKKSSVFFVKFVISR